MIRRFVSVAVLLVAASCGVEPRDVQEVTRPRGIELRVVLDEDDPGGTAFLYQERAFRLGPPAPIEFSRVFRSFDSHRFPAIGFEVDDDDADAFEQWTESIVGSRLAVIVDGRVITAPEVVDALQGGGIITGGAFPFSDAEVRDLLRSMDADRP